LDAFAAPARNRKSVTVEWKEQHRNELLYHLHRVCRVMKEYKGVTGDPEGTVMAFQDILAKDYDGDSVVRAVKEIIHQTGRVPLPSEIGRFLDEPS
jgi:hypothetical protein